MAGHEACLTGLSPTELVTELTRLMTSFTSHTTCTVVAIALPGGAGLLPVTERSVGVTEVASSIGSVVGPARDA